jgi:hypothetical protein
LSFKAAAENKISQSRQNNYSNFAATAVLAVAGILLALSLSHLAAGIALVTGAGHYTRGCVPSIRARALEDKENYRFPASRAINAFFIPASE